MGTPKNWDKRDAHNPFTFIIEELCEDGSVKRQVGGCENIVGAQAMFRALIPHFNETDLLRLRQGGRIMDTVPGTGEEHRKAVARILSS